MSSNLILEEQETIITRVRADKNVVSVYSSDSRVIYNLLKLFPECKKQYNKSYKGIDKDKQLVSVSFNTDVSITRLGSLLFPKYRGSKTNDKN